MGCKCNESSRAIAAIRIVAIQKQRTISAEYQRLASVDDSISGEPLLNAAGQAAFAKQQDASYRSARNKQVSGRFSAFWDGNDIALVVVFLLVTMPMFIGMVRRP